MSPKEIKKIQKRAVEVAEKNLMTGNWTVETTQFFITRVLEQPEEFYFLISAK